MLGKPRILSLFINSFNKFNKHDHSCKILYIHLRSILAYGRKKRNVMKQIRFYMTIKRAYDYPGVDVTLKVELAIFWSPLVPHNHLNYYCHIHPTVLRLQHI